jgi:hypothetical protein
MLPTTKIAGYDITRLLLGSNPFNGFSHFSPARDRWLNEYFTVDRIAELFEGCVQAGINALLGSYTDKLAQAISKFWSRHPRESFYWIAYTHGGLEMLHQSIKMIADAGAAGCYVQGGITYSLLRQDEQRIERLEQANAFIREQGMFPGIGTHEPTAIDIAEERGYDAEFYVMSLNYTDTFSFWGHHEHTAAIIRRASKPVIAIKTLGAGRIEPERGFHYAFRSMKPGDLIAVGLISRQEAEYDAEVAHQILRDLGQAS